MPAKMAFMNGNTTKNDKTAVNNKSNPKNTLMYVLLGIFMTSLNFLLARRESNP